MLQSSFTTFNPELATIKDQEESMSLILSCSRIDVSKVEANTEGPELMVPIEGTCVPDKIGYPDSQPNDQPDERPNHAATDLACPEVMLCEEAQSEPDNVPEPVIPKAIDSLLGLQAQRNDSTPDSLIGHL